MKINASTICITCCSARIYLTLICKSRSSKDERREGNQEWDQYFHSFHHLNYFVHKSNLEFQFWYLIEHLSAIAGFLYL